VLHALLALLGLLGKDGRGNCMCYYRFRSVMDGRRLISGTEEEKSFYLVFDPPCL
jgi:hypothetical protein